MSQELTTQVLECMGKLSDDQQIKVVEFVHSLVRGKPKGVPGKDFAKLAGLIPKEDCKEIARAIEEACERIDENEW